MLADRHGRRMTKLEEMLDERKTQLEDHNSGRRRLNSEVRLSFDGSSKILAVYLVHTDCR